MRTIGTNEPTRYEIAAEHSDGRRYLIAYSAGSPSRRRLLDAVRAQGESIIAACAIGESDQMEFGTQPRPHATCSGWRFTYTGATQRDVRSRGAELPFVRDVARAMAPPVAYRVDGRFHVYPPQQGENFSGTPRALRVDESVTIKTAGTATTRVLVVAADGYQGWVDADRLCAMESNHA